MKKRVLITVGGTGGHVYPAMALAQQLKSKAEVLFVGGGLNSNRYFIRSAFTHHEVSCGMISPRRPLSSLANLARILKGMQQSSKIINSFNPDVVVGFGSYYTVPTLLAAKLRGVPIVLHEANRIPGRVNRLLSQYVALTGVHFPDTVKLLKGKAQEISIPLREGYQLGALSQEQSRGYFGLDLGRITLLVFGGSQGAQAINQMVYEALKLLPALLSVDFQVLHITGDAQSTIVLQKKYADAGIHACVRDFESRMDIAWQAADFMISRAGAGTIAEELEFEVPGILIPFPEAMDNHQESNADFMVDVVKGAVKFRQKDLDAKKLSQEIETFLGNQQKQIKEMQQAMRLYKERTDARKLYEVILEMINGQA
ncbi:MAG: UDP-N-acetylglucosamine--N-acetylmuramyl-(pentapeptide) pyrophosphoryl-undecaprenol N-acetylglucosamine transferase [Parachlamydiaceae bacterium]|nr:UDP-N-acetylglucosamine--N-acetylmuramyl-(pentapeptide) pyrophosphoryl-undecaprenol N-acetylglucosamine transferase [Parachlamydiaceae bacterium]